jgi:hypothetical protein
LLKKNNDQLPHYDRFTYVREANDIDNISIDIDVISCFNELSFHGIQLILPDATTADEPAATRKRCGNKSRKWQGKQFAQRETTGRTGPGDGFTL